MLVMTTAAMLANIKKYTEDALQKGGLANYVLAVTACAIFLLALWLVVEAVAAWMRLRSAAPAELDLEELAVEAGPAESMPPAPNS